MPTINFAPLAPIRCKNCRSYVSCYSKFIDGGAQWKCVICGERNNVPDKYYSPADANGIRTDAGNRPELANAVYELIAPEPYMSRPPQPPVFSIVLDVSDVAIKTGLVKTVCAALAAQLPSIAQDDRVLVSFVTFDTSVHFWHFAEHQPLPTEIVEAITPGGVFTPMPNHSSDLVINLADRLDDVLRFLDILPRRFNETHAMGSGAFGPAIVAALKCISSYGGRMMYFLSTLPTVKPGALTDREGVGKLDIDGKNLFLGNNADYRNIATDATQAYVCIDGYCAGDRYQDVATLTTMSRLTGGTVSFYPQFLGGRDGVKLTSDIAHHMTRETGLEAVFRARVSAGLTIERYHGHFFIRQTNLLNLSNIDSDSSIGIEIKVLDQLPQAQVYLQTALLYTTTTGERRVRVATAPLTVTQDLSVVFDGADLDVIVALAAKRAADKLVEGIKLEDVRKDLDRACRLTIDLHRASVPLSFSVPGDPVQQQLSMLPDTMRLYPLFTLALLKSQLLRMSAHTKMDERAHLLSCFLAGPVDFIRRIVYPTCYALDPSTGDLTVARLSMELVVPSAVYIIEDIHAIYVFIGRTIGTVAHEQLFGTPTATGQLPLVTSSPLGARVLQAVQSLRAGRSSEIPYFIARQDGGLHRNFNDLMIESNVHGQTYGDFLTHLQTAGK